MGSSHYVLQAPDLLDENHAIQLVPDSSTTPLTTPRTPPTAFATLASPFTSTPLIWTNREPPLLADVRSLAERLLTQTSRTALSR